MKEVKNGQRSTSQLILLAGVVGVALSVVLTQPVLAGGNAHGYGWSGSTNTKHHHNGNHRKGSHGHRHGGKRGDRGGSAIIDYIIDPASCAVTVTSTKDISNIQIKDAAGVLLKKWDHLSGETFSDFGMYASLLVDNQLVVKSGRNGKRGMGVEIGDDFHTELQTCLVPDCPFEQVISDFRAVDLDPNNADLITQNDADYCELNSSGEVLINGNPFNGSYTLTLIDNRQTNTNYSEEYDGDFGLVLRDSFGFSQGCTTVRPEYTAGYVPPIPRYSYCTDPQYQDGTLTQSEAQACGMLLGCSEFLK